MKTLIILRHAKSSWAQPGLSDFERPLNKRGLEQLERLSPWLGEQSMPASAFVCSPAVRTRETLKGLQAGLPDNAVVETSFPDELYNGSIDDYMSTIWAQPKSVEALMIVGHNPTCDELSRYLTAPSSPAAQKLMAQHFGTACLARFEIDADDWSIVQGANNQLTHFVRPADLESRSAS